MSQKLYLECTSGISGDMFVGAMLDLGVDEQVLKAALRSLNLPEFQVEISRVSKSGLDACDFRVTLDEEHENHDHDMEYLHGEKAEHGHEHALTHKHSHEHEHRNLNEILEIIEQSEISLRAKQTASDMFKILALAEAEAHGVSIENVHFHEVGAVDSIVDIVAAAVCLDHLGIEDIIIPGLHEGTGFVRCQHGTIPVPVPAVAAIAQAHGLTLHITNTEGEFVTPTGAAIAAAIRTSERLPEAFTIQKTGIGAGKRAYERPSILRAMLIREKDRGRDFIYKLESNIDDSTGEVLGYAMERLLDSGALDVHYIPVYMKKNRPAYQLNVICRMDDLEKLEEIIFTETTTIGIRRQEMERSVLKREMIKAGTSLGEAEVKVCMIPSGKRYYPEYKSVAALSRKSGIPWQEVYRLIEKECRENE